jgi:hypothetical protein
LNSITWEKTDKAAALKKAAKKIKLLQHSNFMPVKLINHQISALPPHSRRQKTATRAKHDFKVKDISPGRYGAARPSTSPSTKCPA